MATMCFEKAGDTYWERRSKASALRATADRMPHSNPKAANEILREAAEIFEAIGMADSAAQCFFDLGKYERAGAHLILGHWSTISFLWNINIILKILSLIVILKINTMQLPLVSSTKVELCCTKLNFSSHLCVLSYFVFFFHLIMCSSAVLYCLLIAIFLESLL